MVDGEPAKILPSLVGPALEEMREAKMQTALILPKVFCPQRESILNGLGQNQRKNYGLA